MAIGDPHVPTELVSQLESANSEKAFFFKSNLALGDCAQNIARKNRTQSTPRHLAARKHRWPFDAGPPIDVVLESTRLPGSFHKDPADRFIIATARVRNLVLVTGDKAIIDDATSGYVKAVGI